MAHVCKNLLIRCMDFRLGHGLKSWLEENELFEDGYDVISLAGASKGLVDEGDGVRNYFLKNISVSIDLHCAERIVLLHHSDCGAYGEYQFASAEEEKLRQIEDMRKAKGILQEKFPKAQVILTWAELKDPHGHETDFEIVER